RFRSSHSAIVSDYGKNVTLSFRIVQRNDVGQNSIIAQSEGRFLESISDLVSADSSVRLSTVLIIGIDLSDDLVNMSFFNVETVPRSVEFRCMVVCVLYSNLQRYWLRFSLVVVTFDSDYLDGEFVSGTI